MCERSSHCVHTQEVTAVLFDQSDDDGREFQKFSEELNPRYVLSSFRRLRVLHLSVTSSLKVKRVMYGCGPSRCT